MATNKTTPGQRVAELLRELSMKQKFYPGWMDNYRRNSPGQKISPETAAHRIACFEELIEDIYTLYPALRETQGSLFGPDEARKLPPQHLERP